MLMITLSSQWETNAQWHGAADLSFEQKSDDLIAKTYRWQCMIWLASPSMAAAENANSGFVKFSCSILQLQMQPECSRSTVGPYRFACAFDLPAA